MKNLLYKFMAICLIILTLFFVYLSFTICLNMTYKFSDGEYFDFLLYMIGLIFTSCYTLVFGTLGVGILFSKPIK